MNSRLNSNQPLTFRYTLSCPLSISMLSYLYSYWPAMRSYDGSFLLSTLPVNSIIQTRRHRRHGMILRRRLDRYPLEFPSFPMVPTSRLIGSHPCLESLGPQCGKQLDSMPTSFCALFACVCESHVSIVSYSGCLLLCLLNYDARTGVISAIVRERDNCDKLG